MDKISRKKTRIYLLFIITVVLTVAANVYVLEYNLDRQAYDAKIINIAGRQRMLSQRISKLWLSGKDLTTHSSQVESDLEKARLEFITAHEKLNNINPDLFQSKKLDSLFSKMNPHFLEMVNTSSQPRTDGDNSAASQDALYHAEIDFIGIMEEAVKEYERLAEGKLKKTKSLVLWLSLLTILLLVSEFMFLVLPQLRVLSKRNEELSVSNRRLSDFAQIASHNLRAPVGNLKMLQHQYDKAENDEERQFLMTKMNSATQTLDTTMDVLTDALKVQSGVGQEKEKIHLEHMLEKILETLESQIKEARAKILADFSSVPTIEYSPIYLESIFLNLISNSLKYRSDSRPLEIRIKSSQKMGRKQLVIADNGLGLDMGRHGRRLFGLNKVFHRHPEAKGVGLFMVRTQVEAMGGRINANSIQGHGMEFTITF